jgi:hypothetical protein
MEILPRLKKAELNEQTGTVFLMRKTAYTLSGRDINNT